MTPSHAASAVEIAENIPKESSVQDEGGRVLDHYRGVNPEKSSTASAFDNGPTTPANPRVRPQ